LQGKSRIFIQYLKIRLHIAKKNGVQLGNFTRYTVRFVRDACFVCQSTDQVFVRDAHSIHEESLVFMNM